MFLFALPLDHKVRIDKQPWESSKHSKFLLENCTCQKIPFQSFISLHVYISSYLLREHFTNQIKGTKIMLQDEMGHTIRT